MRRPDELDANEAPAVPDDASRRLGGFGQVWDAGMISWMRISHAPPDYECPFCGIVQGRGSERTRPEHVIRQDAQVTVFMNPRWWENNRGNVLVVPNEHFENLYELPADYGTPILAASQDAALAMKSAYGCDGVSTRQHNEPAGNQEVWHYHLHVFPRWEGDNLYRTHGYWAPDDELLEMTELLRSAWPG